LLDRPEERNPGERAAKCAAGAWPPEIAKGQIAAPLRAAEGHELHFRPSLCPCKKNNVAWALEDRSARRQSGIPEVKRHPPSTTHDPSTSMLNLEERLHYEAFNEVQ
jgi:hypothetical protein